MSKPYKNLRNTHLYKNFSGNGSHNTNNCYKVNNVKNEYDKVSESDKQTINIKTDKNSDNDIDIDVLKQDFPDTHQYIISEIDRLKSLDGSLNNLQALNLAIGSNCGNNTNFEMCPSRHLQKKSPPTQPPPNQPPPNQPITPIQPPKQELVKKNYIEKGNCVGEGCKIKFSNNKDIGSIISELKIDFYSNDRCGYCNRTKRLFDQENITSSINLLNNKSLPKGADGYPHFYSHTTGKSHTGAPNSVKMLIDKLS